MNLDFDLLIFGTAVAAMGVLAHRLAPDFGDATLIAGIAGGALAVFWGVLGLRGFRRRIWPIATLTILNLVLLAQAVRAWMTVKGGTDALKPVALILTMMLAFGIVQLLNFMRERRCEK